MARRPQCFARCIFVARPTRDGVPAERKGFYEWLAPQVLKVRQVDTHVEEFFVTPEEMKNNPGVVEFTMTPIPDVPGRRSLAILDLSLNPYHLVRDIFLRHVATVVRRLLDSHPMQSVLLLLPGRGLPGTASMLWDLLPRNGRNSHQAGRLTVIADDGSIWPDDAARTYTPEQYRDARMQNREWLHEQLESRIIRKLGHFQFSGHRSDHCARYFYEAEHAVQEVGDLLIDWVREKLQPALAPGAPVTLLSHGRDSDWFHDAVAGAAAVLNVPLVALRGDAPPAKVPAGLSGHIVPIFNVVHTGETFRDVVTWLTGNNLPVAPRALAVISSEREMIRTVGDTTLDWLSGPHRRDRRATADCPQCSLKLPKTPPRAEQHLGIRAFDMWEMFLESGWKAEAFGAAPRDRYKSLPDMRSIFERHGNWIAYKIHHVLKMLNASDEVAFVCPDEPNIEVLAEHLGIILQNRQVTVRVPRSIIRTDNWQGQLTRSAGQEWFRQLTHLKRQRFDKIVIIDETAGQKRTVNGLVRLLREFRLEPLAYLPVVDFSPDIEVPGVLRVPMYQIWKHRRSDL